MKVSCVAAILWNVDGRVLLQQREDRPGLAFAGYWTLPGGKVEEGEQPKEAIRRELMEEIGWEVPLTFWKVYERSHSDLITVVQHVYIGQANRAISSLELNEGQALRYWGAEDIADLRIAYGFDSLLKAFFAGTYKEQSDA